MPALPPPVRTEQEGLLAFLAQQRQALRHAAYGLTEEQLRLAPSASALSVGGLVKHVALTERQWIQGTVLGRPEHRGGQDEYARGFVLADDETMADLLDLQATVAAETEASVAEIDDLDHPVPVPRDAPWFPADVEAWSLRWVLLHVIQESARHAGHADIVRESVDGATQYELLAAAEGWPATDWLTPWRPKAR
jgi:uncharacterized damage-inducible protein DinB